MPETCNNWLGFVNSCVYHAHQTCEIYHVVLFGLEVQQTCEMTVKLKRNLYVRPVNIFLNFLHCELTLPVIPVGHFRHKFRLIADTTSPLL